MSDPSDELQQAEARIKELGDKSTQLLLFLSFAIVAVSTLTSQSFSTNPLLSRSAIQGFVLAVFPVLVGVLPLKEFRRNNSRWYVFIARLRFVTLWVAVSLCAYGTVQFFRALTAVPLLPR